TGSSFRERFLQQLPNDVRVTLAALQLRDLNAFAIAAGAVMAVKGRVVLNVVRKQPASPPQSTTKRASTDRDKLCWVGNRADQPLVATSATGHKSRLLYVWDRYAG
ncbi:hypothetical protein LSAT2_030532, partial [Lamellibrachia satsuma]